MGSLLLVMNSWNFSFAYTTDQYKIDKVQYSVGNFVNKTTYYDAAYGLYGGAYYLGLGYCDSYTMFSGDTYFSTYGQYVVLATPQQPTSSDFPAILYSTKNNSSNTITSYSQYSYNSAYNLYYTSIYTDVPFTPLASGFSDLSSCLSAIRTYINNSLLPPTLSSVTLQNGYLAVIDLESSGSSYAFSFSSFSDKLSNFISGDFPYANQRYWFTDTLPSEDTVVPASGALLVDWEPADPKTVLGQSHYMQASLSGTSTGRYLCLYNPPVHLVSFGSGHSQTQVVNEPVTFAVPQGLTVYIMDSSGSLSLVSGSAGLVGTLTGDVGVGTATASGGAIEFTDPQTDEPFVQNPGGSTDTTSISNQSVNSFLSQIQETLDNFVDSFLSLLSAPISHIQQLISAGSDFFQVLVGLFSWLPSDISTLLLSAFVVVVVIGVIKLLL